MKFLLHVIVSILLHGSNNCISAQNDFCNQPPGTILNPDRDIRFYLYTVNNKDDPEQLWVNNIKILSQSNYDFAKSTKFITHGTNGDLQTDSCVFIRDAFLDYYDYNIIVIDWGEVAKHTSYYGRIGMNKVFHHVAGMIDFLVDEGTNPDDITLIGHSLGVYVMLFAGYYSMNKIGHLINLDLPSPVVIKECYKDIDLRNIYEIASTMANFIETVYTKNGDSKTKGLLGNVEFYPNGGGPEQPGCEDDPVDSDPQTCAHDRAYVFYAEALKKPRSFIAIKCSDYESFLAGDCENNNVVLFPNWSSREKERGIYYLRTASSSPFGLGFDGIRSISS